MTTSTKQIPLGQRTPPDIDAELAELDRKLAQVGQTIAYHIENVHRALGERRSGTRGHSKWPTEDETAVESLRQRLNDGAEIFNARKTLDSLDSANREYERLYQRTVELEHEWERRGCWSRFFIVQNNNGHIHSTRACSTCRPTTRFGWIPELSGLTEKDAVEAKGPLLCTVCFPTAPVEWTIGKPKKERCKGSGQSPKGGTLKRHGMRSYGDCPVCGERGTLTPNGYIRAHAPKKTEEAE